MVLPALNSWMRPGPARRQRLPGYRAGRRPGPGPSPVVARVFAVAPAEGAWDGEVVLLSLGTGDAGCSGGCGGDSCGAGCDSGGDPPSFRVPVLACRDALRAAGATVRLIRAESDAEIDKALPAPDADTRLVVAADGDGELRAVLRRMARRYAPPPSRRPDDLPDNRTLPDLPPVGVLPLAPAGAEASLAARLGLPHDPAEVAAAVLAGRSRRLDLLRTDGGSVTLHGALLGGADESSRPVAWRARVNVDDAVLTDGTDPLLACAVVNGDGYAELDGLPLVTRADPADGTLDVAVALPRRAGHRLLGNRRTRIEVRRARGRAVTVTPLGDVPFVDDGVAGTLARKRTWWMEPSAWAVYHR